MDSVLEKSSKDAKTKIADSFSNPIFVTLNLLVSSAHCLNS